MSCSRTLQQGLGCHARLNLGRLGEGWSHQFSGSFFFVMSSPICLLLYNKMLVWELRKEPAEITSATSSLLVHSLKRFHSGCSRKVYQNYPSIFDEPCLFLNGILWRDSWGPIQATWNSPWRGHQSNGGRKRRALMRGRRSVAHFWLVSRFVSYVNSSSVRWAFALLSSWSL